MKYKDYYDTLGVPRSATQDDIKKAYRKLARKYHPDVSKAADAEPRFKEINEANEVLKDPEKRAAYDQMGSNWKAGQEFQPPPNWDAGFEFRSGGPGGGFGGGSPFGADFDPSDFFESLFGRGARGARRRRRVGAAQRQHPGRGPPRQGADRPRGRVPRRRAQHRPARAEGNARRPRRPRGAPARRPHPARHPPRPAAAPGQAGRARVQRRAAGRPLSRDRVQSASALQASRAPMSTSSCRSRPGKRRSARPSTRRRPRARCS